MEPKRYRDISQSLFNYIGTEGHRSQKARAASRGFNSIDAWYYSSQRAYDFDLKEIIRKSWLGHKQPTAQKLDLVLNPALLPACGRGAGHRLYHVMVHQR